MRKIHSSVRIYEKTKRSKEFFLAAVNTSAIYFKTKAVNEKSCKYFNNSGIYKHFDVFFCISKIKNPLVANFHLHFLHFHPYLFQLFSLSFHISLTRVHLATILQKKLRNSIKSSVFIVKTEVRPSLKCLSYKYTLKPIRMKHGLEYHPDRTEKTVPMHFYEHHC